MDSHPPLVGLVGCGLWGRAILRDLVGLGCRVAVAEPDADRAERARTLGASDVAAAAEALPPVEGYVVATPATTHAAVVSDLLDRGVPVFCEKPLTTDEASAAALAARGRGRLFVMHVWRYHRGVAALGEIARTGALGQIRALRTVRTNWTSPRLDTDPVWTLVPHDLTIALAILGTIPEPRAAVAETVGGRAVSMTALLGEAPWMSLDCSTRFREKRREVRLHCEGGVAVLPDADSPFLEILRSGPAPDAVAELDRRPLEGDPPLKAELASFVRHLRGGPPPPTGGDEGALVVAAVARLRRLAGLAP